MASTASSSSGRRAPTTRRSSPISVGRGRDSGQGPLLAATATQPTRSSNASRERGNRSRRRRRQPREGAARLPESDVTARLAEATYAGQSKVASVSCVTCHSVTDATDPHRTGKAVCSRIVSFACSHRRSRSGDDREEPRQDRGHRYASWHARNRERVRVVSPVAQRRDQLHRRRYRLHQPELGPCTRDRKLTSSPARAATNSQR